MFDAPAPTLQRSHGAAAVTLGPEGLRRLAQSGSAKAMLPRGPGPAEVVFLNTSGGLTGGDRLDLSLTLAAGTTAVATTQTAERAYRAEGPPARVRVALAAGVAASPGWGRPAGAPAAVGPRAGGGGAATRLSPARGAGDDRAMFDAPAPTLQRSHGAAAVTLGPEGLRRLAQSGSAKAMLPRGPGPAEVVFLNTSGGLTGGDRLDLSLTLAAGTTAVATTQTAERAYRAEGPPARVRVALAAGAGAWLDWLPQETILFDGAALDRETTVDLGPGAGCLMVETLVLGRAAMGETVCRLHLREARTVRRAGRPVAAERLALDDAALARPGAAMLAGARAIATLIRIDPAAPPPLAAARAALCEPGVIAAASAAGERLVVRLAAADGFPLRRQIARLLAALRPGPLPRVWQGTLA